LNACDTDLGTECTLGTHTGLVLDLVAGTTLTAMALRRHSKIAALL